MKILVVEDNAEKRERVLALLRAEGQNADIHIAEDFVHTIRKLNERFDLVILDMVLPMRSGDVPQVDVGYNILDEMYEGVSCIKPEHIICLSEYVGENSEMIERVGRRLVHLIQYDSSGDAWSRLLSEKIDYLSSSNTDRSSFSASRCDVAIITASPVVEMNAVLDLPGDWATEFVPKDGLFYHSVEWTSSIGKILRVVACSSPTMGMTAAAITAAKLVARFRPEYLAMSGILASTDSSHDFGDILVAESVYDYGSGKIVETEGGRIFKPSPQQINIDTTLRALIRNWESRQLCMADIGEICKGKAGSYVPKLELGIIASGAAVVQSSGIVDEILENSRKTIGIEMEAYGVAQAAYLFSEPKPKMLIAKAVSDFADERKDDSAQQLAAITSSRFLFYFFTTDEGVWSI